MCIGAHALAAALAAAGVAYSLWGATALGAFRDGDVLPWEEGVAEFAVHASAWPAVFAPNSSAQGC
jgi:hypothetical protein